jgi:hypothetical protein
MNKSGQFEDKSHLSIFENEPIIEVTSKSSDSLSGNRSNNSSDPEIVEPKRIR